MNVYEIEVEGMRCSMCEAHVADAVRKALPEAKSVKASKAKGLVTFVYAGEKFQSVLDAISALGYGVGKIQTREAKKGFLGRWK